MSLVTANMISWHRFPAQIRLMILERLLQDGCRVADLAAVSREWQAIIERHNFSRIKLTFSRLADFGSMVRRNRSHVRYIWLCLELQEYECPDCGTYDIESMAMSYADNAQITTAFQDLFSTLSVWEPDDHLLLDISVYSPSDSEYEFQHLTFEPDVAFETHGRGRHEKHPMLVKASNHHHRSTAGLRDFPDIVQSWLAGGRDFIPHEIALERVFQVIMEEGPFDTDEEEGKWWQQLPSVPAVTGVLLRQQSRRRWKPAALAHMFARLPGLKEIHYEPWREWTDYDLNKTDQSLRLLFESLPSDRLRRLILFENFNQTYAPRYNNWGRTPTCLRIPAPHVSQAVAKASLTLEHLSASFMVDASDFFKARQLSWKWPNLTWLALTSRLLVPQQSSTELDNMLRAAAAAAMNMPNLETMEIWNGDEGLAMLFSYQRAERWKPAVVTWRGTWELTLPSLVIQAWDSVALTQSDQRCNIVKELLDASICLESHGDAICHLKLSRPVVRPVSLRQIQMEHTTREGA